MAGEQELLRAFYDAFNAGDYQRCLDALAPDVEYHELEGMPGARGMVGVYRGRAEVARWYAEFLGTWDPGFRSEPRDMTALADGRVLVEETWRGRARHSAVDVQQAAVALYTVRDGLIAGIRYYRTKDEALRSPTP